MRYVSSVVRNIKRGVFWERLMERLSLGMAIFFRKIIACTVSVDSRKVMFMTFQNEYTCNPKYIAEQILKENLNCDMVWAIGRNTNKALFPKEIRLVRRNSWRFFRELASSRVWVDNALNFIWLRVPKKKEQVYLQTWHGSMGLKRIGRDDIKNKQWLARAEWCDRDTDYCISNSEFENRVYRESYWPTVNILPYGHARNDVFFRCEPGHVRELKEKICRTYGLCSDYRIALYAPTFRDDKALDHYDLDYSRVLAALKKRWGGEWYLFARFHFQSKSAQFAEQEDNVVNLSHYPDMQELMLVADVGITDYSSWICDYLLTRMPGFIYASDLSHYGDERGLYYPLDSTPFPVATRTDELASHIEGFDDAIYQSKIELFLADKGCVEDGYASARVVGKIRALLDEPEHA
ncbi:MAG: CDP-glycerol--glycerophosphate glycerophosphotransferase [Pseudomonas sp.]|nr:MAG: CDP-glycerol--glycerophosphate glycerophosphotransferase [Pseudomonas sp.]